MSITIMDILEGIEFELPEDPDARYIHNGVKVPRVTEVLREMWYEESLIKWANYLGFKRKNYEKELDYASYIGTTVHDSVEEFLSTEEFPLITPDSHVINAITGFNQWYSIVKNKGFAVLSMEQKLTCPWFGGTYDLLANIDNKICLIDFKTSKFIGIKYYMQLAAYMYMLHLNNIKIDIAMILRLHKDEPQFTEYVVDLSIQQNQEFMRNCFETFMSLAYAYFNRVKLENQFKNLNFKGV